MREKQKQALQTELGDKVLAKIIVIQRWTRAKLLRCRFLHLRRSAITIQVCKYKEYQCLHNACGLYRYSVLATCSSYSKGVVVRRSKHSCDLKNHMIKIKLRSEEGGLPLFTLCLKSYRRTVCICLHGVHRVYCVSTVVACLMPYLI